MHPTRRKPRKFSARRSHRVTSRPGAPRQGEHNRDVLREILDYDDAKIDALARDGVVVEG